MVFVFLFLIYFTLCNRSIHLSSTDSNLFLFISLIFFYFPKMYLIPTLSWADLYLSIGSMSSVFFFFLKNQMFQQKSASFQPCNKSFSSSLMAKSKMLGAPICVCFLMTS